MYSFNNRYYICISLISNYLIYVLLTEHVGKLPVRVRRKAVRPKQAQSNERAKGMAGCEVKVLRRLISYVSKVYVLVTSLVFVIPFFSYGMGITQGIRPAYSTPFDSKLMRPGLFELNTPKDSNASIESLFRTARSFRYVSDGSQDYWQTAEETDSKRAGDCEDKAIWLFARLKQSAYNNVQLVIGKYKSIDINYHVWVTCTDESGNTYLLDPAIQKRIWTNESFASGFYTQVYSYDGVNRYRY